ncbi:MAG: methyl-accepting chemotaxis protein [Clostridium sp.]|uniref:methyl-accepting chemotaxis protein n=1 Tax=Clostridium sp. TaxID=1506 RepID=UPI0039EC4AE9
MNFFTNMKLSYKISLLSITSFIFLIAIGFVSIGQISKLNSKIMELNNSRMVPIIELENIKSDIEYIRQQCNSIMDAADSTSSKKIQDNISARESSVKSKLSKYKDDTDFKTLISNYNKFIEAKNTFIKNQSERGNESASVQADGNGKIAGPPTDISNLDKTKTDLTESFDKIINTHAAAARQSYINSEKDFKIIIIEYIVIMIVCLIIAMILSLVIIRSIVEPVKKVTKKLKEVSENDGDLTQRIGYKSNDEIGQLSINFDRFMDKLQSIIREVIVSTETISSSSKRLNRSTSVSTQALRKISDTVIEIARGTSDGAAAVEETTASLSEAANFSEATSNSAKNTAYNSKKAEEAAEDSAKKIVEIVSSITDIADSSKEVLITINQLDESSKRIEDIIKIITSISQQTNLLALNAAIEAARAGEAGKGFNVVADEIRKLADESNNAAQEISDLIKENQLKSNSAVNSANEVEEKVSAGVKKASEIEESIKNIIKNIEGISNDMNQIDNANEEQARGTKEIEKAIAAIANATNEMAQDTENISVSIEDQLSTMTEIERTTEKLSEMAKTLNKITCGFTV